MRRLLPGLLLLALVPLPALAAEGDPEAGWWSRSKLGGAAPAEAPDTVPDGGLQVAGDPTGPVSVAALRVAPAEGTRVTGLRLQVARATGTPRVLVCPVAARWRPVDGDRLDAAPPADCGAASVEGAVADGVLVVDLPAAFGEGELDVRLEPAPGTAFALDLAPVTAAAVRTAPTSAAAPPAEGAPAPVRPAPAAPAPVPATEPFAGGPAVDPVAAPVTAEEPAALPPLAVAGPPVPPDLPAAAPPVPVAAPGLAAPGAAAPALLPRAPEALDSRREQLAALALLAGLLALGVGLQRVPARAPVRLGGGARLVRGDADPAPAPVVTAVPAARGVGRFRAPRTRPPVAL